MFVYCNHSRWSPRPHRICEHQKSFIEGKITEPCIETKSHPLATVKVEGKCLQCGHAHQAIDQKLQKAKDMISQNKKALLGADKTCRTILEGADTNMRASEDEAELEKFEEQTGMALFLKNRKQGDNAKLFI